VQSGDVQSTRPRIALRRLRAKARRRLRSIRATNLAASCSPDGAGPPKAAQRNPGKALLVAHGTQDYGACGVTSRVEPAGCFVGELKIAPEHGPVGPPVTVTGEGFPAGEDVDLVWGTVTGSWKVSGAPQAAWSTFVTKVAPSRVANRLLTTVNSRSALSAVSRPMSDR